VLSTLIASARLFATMFMLVSVLNCAGSGDPSGCDKALDCPACPRGQTPVCVFGPSTNQGGEWLGTCGCQ
jgi:hypothetical protein